MKRKKYFKVFLIFTFLAVTIVFSIPKVYSADSYEIAVYDLDEIYSIQEEYYGLENDSYYWHNIGPSNHASFDDLFTVSTATAAYLGYLDDEVNGSVITSSSLEGYAGVGSSNVLWQYMADRLDIDNSSTAIPSVGINSYFVDHGSQVCFSPTWTLVTTSTDAKNIVGSNVLIAYFHDTTNSISVGCICFGYIQFVNSMDFYFVINPLINNNLSTNPDYYYCCAISSNYFVKAYYINNLSSINSSHHNFTYQQNITNLDAGHWKICGDCGHHILEGHSFIPTGIINRFVCIDCGYIRIGNGNDPIISSEGGAIE